MRPFVTPDSVLSYSLLIDYGAASVLPRREADWHPFDQCKGRLIVRVAESDPLWCHAVCILRPKRYITATFLLFDILIISFILFCVAPDGHSTASVGGTH